MKVTVVRVVGGGSLLLILRLKNFISEVVLVDIKENFAEGEINGPNANIILKRI